MWEIGNILPILMVSSKVTGRAVTFLQRSDLAVVPGPRPRRRQRDIPPRPVVSLCRVPPLSISLCHSATNGENMRCSPRGRRARERAAVTPVHVQLGPAPYCFFRASEREKGLTYEPRSMHGVKRRRQPAGHLCPGPVIFGNTNAQKMLCRYHVFFHQYVPYTA